MILKDVYALGKPCCCIKAKDLARDMQTQVLTVSLSDLDIHKTGNLHSQLKICEGARVLLTYNMDLDLGNNTGSQNDFFGINFVNEPNKLYKLTTYIKF